MKKQNGHQSQQSSQGFMHIIRVLGITVLLVGVLVAAALVINQSGSVSKTSVNLTENESEDAFSGVSADEILHMSAQPDGLVVLTDKQTRYYNTNGELLSENAHSCHSPTLSVNGNNVLLYDLGGNLLRVEKNGKVYSTDELPGEITVATIGKTCNYAYVLNSHEGYQSNLYVKSYSGELQYKCGYASDYITALCLSDNGKQVAVGVFGVDNAERVSKLQLFRFNKKEAAVTATFPNATIYKTVFINTKTLAVFTDNGVYSVNTNNGESTLIAAYSADDVSEIAAFNSTVGAYIQNLYGNEHNEVFTFFVKSAEKLYTHSYTEKAVKALAGTKYAGVVFKNRAEIFNAKNAQIAQISFNETCRNAAMYGKDIYILTVSGIHHYNF